MNTNPSAVRKLATRGTFTARIDNPQATPPVHDFQGASDKMVMLDQNGVISFHATQIIGPDIHQRLGFDISISSNLLPADGQQRTFAFPSQATSCRYWSYESFANKA